MQSGQIILELEGKKKDMQKKNNPPNPERL